MAKVNPKNVPAQNAPTTSTKPTASPDEKVKSGRDKRKKYPIKLDAEGKIVKLTAIPDDYNPKEHQPLKRTWFEDEGMWWELKAASFERQAKKCREHAEEYRKLGNVADRKKAKKFLNLRKQYEALREQLAAQGVDVDNLEQPAVTEE